MGPGGPGEAPWGGPGPPPGVGGCGGGVGRVGVGGDFFVIDVSMTFVLGVIYDSYRSHIWVIG